MEHTSPTTLPGSASIMTTPSPDSSHKNVFQHIQNTQPSVKNNKLSQILQQIKKILENLIDAIREYFNTLTNWNSAAHAFIKAAETGDLNCLTDLINQNLNINTKDKHDNTALMLAAMNGHSDCVKLLLSQKNVDINAKDKCCDTALTLAARKGHLDCVKLLLSHDDIDINAKDNLPGMTALMLAASEGHSHCINALLSHDDIDINAEDKLGKTALMLAAENGHLDCVKFLCQKNVDNINAKNEFGKTALMLATENGHLDCVKFLCQKNVDNMQKMSLVRQL